MPNMIEKFLVVFCMVPDEETASNISKKLVENNLAACCNIVSGVKSIYRWEEKITEDSELLIIIKTKSTIYKEMQESLIKWHPYEVPEIIALQIKEGNKDYLNWIEQNVKT